MSEKAFGAALFAKRKSKQKETNRGSRNSFGGGHFFVKETIGLSLRERWQPMVDGEGF
jgi:hypothetical protein